MVVTVPVTAIIYCKLTVRRTSRYMTLHVKAPSIFKKPAHFKDQSIDIKVKPDEVSSLITGQRGSNERKARIQTLVFVTLKPTWQPLRYFSTRCKRTARPGNIKENRTVTLFT